MIRSFGISPNYSVIIFPSLFLFVFISVPLSHTLHPYHNLTNFHKTETWLPDTSFIVWSYDYYKTLNVSTFFLTKKMKEKKNP